MKHKNSLLAISILTISILLTVSCKKYPDGPLLSLRSRSERLSNTWKIENYKINGNDFTSLIPSYTETFTKNGSYNYSWSVFEGSGTWSFQNHDKEVKLNGNDDQSSRTLYILKLEERALWYYYMDGNDKHEFHLNEK
jgi:hypothetical protein